MIRLENLNIRYLNTLINDGSISIPSNKVTVIKGKSGIGKTTLLYRIGLISDDTSYDYYYDGKKLNLSDSNLCSDYRRNNIGFALQENDLINHLSVSDTLKYYANINQIEITQREILELLSLMQLDIDVNQNIMTLSLGERKRLSIACALIKKPKLLILDEPTASLDIENTIVIFKIIKQLSKDMTIVLTSHSEYVDDYSDVIYTIENYNLIKVKGEISDLPIHVNNSNNIKFSIIKKYVNLYFEYYKFTYVLMIMVFLLSVLSSTMLLIIINNNKTNSQKLLIGQYENKLLVTKDFDSKYLDEDYSSYINMKKNNAYPLYQMSTFIQDKEVYIIPYFDNDDFSKYLESSFENSKNGLYMDSQTYYALHENNICVTVKCNGYVCNIDYMINGVFKDSKLQHYTSNGNRFIYMPYNMMSEIYKKAKGNHKYVAYVLLYDSYEELSKDKNQLKDQYNVNDTFIDSSLMNKLNSYYTHMELLITSIIIFITVLVDIILNNQLYFKRKKEISILKITGIRNKNILNILLIEYLMEFIKSVIPATMIEILLIIILNMMSIQTLLLIIIINFIYFIILLIERMIISHLFISKVKMESTLRSE